MNWLIKKMSRDKKGKNRSDLDLTSKLVYRHRNAFFRFEFTLDGLIHPFSQAAGDPDLSAKVNDSTDTDFGGGLGSLFQAVVSGTGISGRVLSVWIDDGLYKASPRKQPKLLKQQLSFPCLILFLSWMHQNANYQKHNTQYTKKYPYYYRKFFKEIACQTNGENGLTQVSYDFSNKFPACLINNYHHLNHTPTTDICQVENRVTLSL